jgi:ribosome maturation factor RimP
MAVSLAQEIIALLEPLAESHGYELVTAQVAGGGRHRTVSVNLDRDGGIDVEAVAAASEWVSDALDGVSRLSGPYMLEVSSPGIERALRTSRDFERFMGSQVVVHTTQPIDGRSRFTGELAAFDGVTVVIAVDGEQHRVPFDAIERARLKADFHEVGEGSGRRT